MLTICLRRLIFLLAVCNLVNRVVLSKWPHQITENKEEKKRNQNLSSSFLLKTWNIPKISCKLFITGIVWIIVWKCPWNPFSRNHATHVILNEFQRNVYLELWKAKKVLGTVDFVGFIKIWGYLSEICTEVVVKDACLMFKMPFTLLILHTLNGVRVWHKWCCHHGIAQEINIRKLDHIISFPA